MTKLQIPHNGPRVETGPVQFGDDWPGMFIRGDNAMYYAMQIRALRLLLGESANAVWHPLTVLEGLADCIENEVIVK